MRSRGTGGRRRPGEGRPERVARPGRHTSPRSGGGSRAREAERERPRRSSARSHRRGKSDDYEERRVQWETLARRLGGRFVAAPKALKDALHIPHRSWQVTVDTQVQSDGNSVVFYTQVQAPFLAQDDFTLRVSGAGLGSRMLGWLGFRGIRVGDPRIDARYVIRGSNVGRVRSFFLDGRLRAVLSQQGSCRLEVRDLSWRDRSRYRRRVRQVRIRTKGEFLEPERVISLIELCRVTLDRLATSGAASPSGVDPRDGR